MATGFVKKFSSEFAQLPRLFQIWFALLCFSFVVSVISIPKACNETQRQEAKKESCRELCLPNGFKEVRANQCFCEASVVVKPLPEVK